MGGNEGAGQMPRTLEDVAQLLVDEAARLTGGQGLLRAVKWQVLLLAARLAFAEWYRGEVVVDEDVVVEAKRLAEQWTGTGSADDIGAMEQPQVWRVPKPEYPGDENPLNEKSAMVHAPIVMWGGSARPIWSYWYNHAKRNLGK